MKNQIYYGDNLDVLRNNIVSESVDLCYIDPPFNSNRNYNQIYNNVGKEDTAQAQAFVDTWTWDDKAEQGLNEIINNMGGVFTVQSIDLILGLEKVLKKGTLFAYLVSMTLRIAEIHRVLKPTGSFYLHCDPTASHYLKLVLDGLFCPRGGEFRNEIIWKRTSSHNRAKRWGAIHDVLFYYSKSKNPVWNRVLQDLDADYVKSFYKLSDDKGIYSVGDLTGAGKRTGSSGKSWRGVDPTSKGRHWELPPDRALPEWFVFPENYALMSVQERLDVLDAQEFIAFPKKEDGVPRFKRYLSENSGSGIQDVITDIQPISAQAAERLGYPTQKPEALLERIINASSNEGDVVLDAYCGCGTTIAVAHRFKRKWIGIDITYQSISLILKRLEDAFTKDFKESAFDKESAIPLEKIEVSGVPKDFESAVALANKSDDKTRKEFEKWMVLTFSKNQAIINEKKGGDSGIDGIAYITHNFKRENKKVIFSVKSNKNVTPSMLRDLVGVVDIEKGAIGFLLTLYPMPSLVKLAKEFGVYHNDLTNKDYQKIQVINVDDIFNGVFMELPNAIDVVKTANPKIREQKDLF